MKTQTNLNVPGIYTITCTENGRVYVGQAQNIRIRWQSHRWHLADGSHRNRHLQNAWKKYGPDAFVFEIAELMPVGLAGDALAEALADAEVRVLALHPKHFNLMEVGEKRLKASDETREKLSDERLERWSDPAYRTRVRATMQMVASDPEFQARRGAAISAAYDDPAIREARSGISTALWRDGDFRAARSQERLANWQDPEYRAQQNASRRASWSDPSSREKRIAGLKASWADPVKRAERQAKMRAGMKPTLTGTIETVLRERAPKTVHHDALRDECAKRLGKTVSDDVFRVTIERLFREGRVDLRRNLWCAPPD